MRIVITQAEKEIALEQEADRLLRVAPPNPERPVYTERQLARHGARYVRVRDLRCSSIGIDADTRDEIRFLANISRLEPFGRTCIRLWIDGWTQQEMSRTMGISQGEVSRQLRDALRACYDHTPITFREFSKHTIYRKPSHGRKSPLPRKCLYCGEAFLMFTGEGRYCSSSCQQAAISPNK